jgi:hypothetical protein
MSGNMYNERVAMETQQYVLVMVQLGTFRNAYTSSAICNRLAVFLVKAVTLWRIYVTHKNENYFGPEVPDIFD